MITLPDATVWLVIVLLAIGTYLIRFSFIGILGDRDLSPFTLKLLRFVPVSVMPGLVAPLVLWPEATGGQTDPARLTAALAALLVGALAKSVLGAIGAGMAVLYLGLALV
jgi:branched-subunit amino acid transport protein